jgi:hypothetical protein
MNGYEALVKRYCRQERSMMRHASSMARLVTTDLTHDSPHTYMCNLYLFNFLTSTSILIYLEQILQPVVVKQSDIWEGAWD